MPCDYKATGKQAGKSTPGRCLRGRVENVYFCVSIIEPLIEPWTCLLQTKWCQPQLHFFHYFVAKTFQSNMERVIYYKNSCLFKLPQITLCSWYLLIKPILALISTSTGLRVRGDPMTVRRQEVWNWKVWNFPLNLCGFVQESSRDEYHFEVLKGTCASWDLAHRVFL